MIQLLTKEQLEVKFTIPDFVLNTQKQIAKDFALSGVFFADSFESNTLDYVEIALEVEQKLLELMKLGETQLLQLLYQIDVPQQDFLNIVQENDFANQLADIIIRREAYKVYLRSKF